MATTNGESQCSKCGHWVSPSHAYPGVVDGVGDPSKPRPCELNGTAKAYSERREAFIRELSG